jgi:signal transduction histidine kinase
MRLDQVLLNLVLNAAHAMESPRASPGHELRSCVRTEDGFVVVEIADTGPGIPPAVLDRVFDPFFTTNERGTGVGLFTCRTIVQELGGRLELASHRDGGTTARVVLPPARSAA